MSLAVLCAPCEMGDHDHHDAVGTTRPGLIGGHYCPCPGGCEPQSNPVLEAMLASVTWPAEAERPKDCGCGHETCPGIWSGECPTRDIPPGE